MSVTEWAIAAAVLGLVWALLCVALHTLDLLPLPMFGKKWNPKGLHCYVTGGNSGLGLALAKLLVKQGAHVSIVARSEEKLKLALEELEANRVDPKQILQYFSFALDTAAGAAAAVDAACVSHGGIGPDAMFLCAGACKPGFYFEMDEAKMQQGMKDGYWVQAWSALAGTKKMVKDGKKGKICFVGSILSYMSFIGFSNYAPPKQALRGLADSLRSELMLYGISIHMFFPGSMYTPCWEEENKTKPKITLEIEEGDPGVTADVAAASLYRGVVDGTFHITPSFTANIFRASTKGSSPHQNVAVDAFYSLIAWVGVPMWRWGVDKKVLAHRAEHRKYLADRGLI